MLVVTDYSSAGKDRSQIEIPAQFLARVVQTSPQTQAAVVLADKQIHAVKSVTIRVMPDTVTTPDEVVVSMAATETVIAAFDSQCYRDDAAIVLDHDLAFVKILDQGQ